MDKFKEVNKSNDNASKAQQYLDGLLRIPFGNFKKESIIGFLGVYLVKHVSSGESSGWLKRLESSGDFFESKGWGVDKEGEDSDES